MIKIFAIFTVLTVMISTAAVYNLKQGTYDLEEEKRSTSTKMLKDREAIKVLKAEMAYLSRPERIERLSKRHLILGSTTNDQLVTDVNELSERENFQIVSLPVDNFRPFLPRQKPDPSAVSKVPVFSSNGEQVVAIDFDAKPVKEEVKKEVAETLSLYDRILAKIGN